MPDNEQQIYTLPNNGDGWATGDVITADKMNAIGNVLHNTSVEVVNAVNENIDSNGPNNDILARKLDGMVKYFDTDQVISNNDPRLQYNRMYVQKMPENQEEIIVPKQSEYLQFKKNFVSPFTKANNYAVGAYVEYNDKVYKVLTAIAANADAADDATAWNAIASGSIREINVMQEVGDLINNVMQELDNLINVYSNDSQLTQEQNRIWIQQNSNSVEVPTMEEFNSVKNSVLTVNATPVSTSNLSQWTDLTLDKTNTEILTAAASGNCIVNLNIFGTTIICHQWERSTNSVFFNGFSINNVLFIYNINITQSAASVLRIGYIPIEQI